MKPVIIDHKTRIYSNWIKTRFFRTLPLSIRCPVHQITYLKTHFLHHFLFRIRPFCKKCIILIYVIWKLSRSRELTKPTFLDPDHFPDSLTLTRARRSALLLPCAQGAHDEAQFRLGIIRNALRRAKITRGCNSRVAGDYSIDFVASNNV